MLKNTDNSALENILLSEIPERKYSKSLVINGERKLRFNTLRTDLIEVWNLNSWRRSSVQIIDSPPISVQRDLVRKCLKHSDSHRPSYDLIIISFLLYPEYIGSSLLLNYDMIDKLLNSNGILATLHTSNASQARFPYPFSTFGFECQTKDFTLEIYYK